MLTFLLLFLDEESACTRENWMSPNEGPCWVSFSNAAHAPSSSHASMSHVDAYFKCLLHPLSFFDCILQCHSIATRASLASCSTRVARVAHADFDNNCVYRVPLFRDAGVFSHRGHAATFHSTVGTWHPFLYSLMSLGILFRLPLNCSRKFLWK